MTTNKHCKLLILGSGPAGCTAAIYAARANLNPVLITGTQHGGQLTTTPQIDNWPGEHGISGSDLMDKLIKHVQLFDIEMINDEITSCELNSKPFKLIGDKTNYSCDALIVATGAAPKYLGVPGEKKFIGRGVSTCATCDGFFYKGQKVAVIGGGNAALEEALYLADLASHVTVVHRRDQFRGDKILADQIVKRSKDGNISVEWDSELTEIVGDKSGVTNMRLKNKKTDKDKEVDVHGVFISVGHIPRSKIFEGQLEMDNGYIFTRKFNKNMVTAASVDGVFAAGDVTDQFYQQAITSAGTGCMAALDAKRYIEGQD